MDIPVFGDTGPLITAYLLHRTEKELEGSLLMLLYDTTKNHNHSHMYCEPKGRFVKSAMRVVFQPWDTLWRTSVEKHQLYGQRWSIIMTDTVPLCWGRKGDTHRGQLTNKPPLLGLATETHSIILFHGSSQSGASPQTCLLWEILPGACGSWHSSEDHESTKATTRSQSINVQQNF